MKPLAAPVLGGMISSLAHVLLVTPVIFLLIRERQMSADLQEAHVIAPAIPAKSTRRLRPGLIAGVVLLVIAVGVVGLTVSRQRRRATTEGVVIHTVRAGSLSVLLRSSDGMLRLGPNTFALEFRDSTGTLVDVGMVRATANMAMPGMVMSGGMQVEPATRKGRYDASANFGMAGAWHMTIDWNGSSGRGSVSFDEAVQ